MQIDLNEQEIETLLESLEYSKQRVADAERTPYEVRQENLARIDAVTSKIRGAAKGPDNEQCSTTDSHYPKAAKIRTTLSALSAHKASARRLDKGQLILNHADLRKCGEQ